MTTFRARVENSRIVIDGTTELPDGTEVMLAVVDHEKLPDDERAGLATEIEPRRAEIRTGQGIAVEDLLGDQMAAAGPWQGDTEEEILDFLRNSRRAGHGADQRKRP